MPANWNEFSPELQARLAAASPEIASVIEAERQEAEAEARRLVYNAEQNMLVRLESIDVSMQPVRRAHWEAMLKLEDLEQREREFYGRRTKPSPFKIIMFVAWIGMVLGYLL